jgi:hypothetical protein
MPTPEDLKITLPEGEETPEDNDTQSEQPEYSEVELEAMKFGWKPESEFVSKNGRKWKTAEKFLEDKPLYDKIDEQHKTVKDLKRALDAMRKHYDTVRETEYKRALDELKAQRRQALEEGDLVRAEEIRDEIDETKQRAPKPEVVEDNTRVADALKVWKGENDWYEQDEDMTAYADGYGNKLLKQGVDPVEVLEQVTKKVRAAFPQKFRNPNRDTAPRVEGNARKGSGRSGPDDSFMSPAEIQIMERFLKSGAPITREEYIRDMKKSKGVK